MKIYFDKSDEGHSTSYLTPGKLYEVVDFVDDGVWAKIKDDDGDQIMVRMSSSSLTGSSWKVFSEETKAPSISETVASLESERNALANSINRVDELLARLSVLDS